ncbi:MAG: hypothetical protein ACYCX4_02005 [Bacillota bacterium]
MATGNGMLLPVVIDTTDRYSEEYRFRPKPGQAIDLYDLVFLSRRMSKQQRK